MRNKNIIKHKIQLDVDVVSLSMNYTTTPKLCAKTRAKQYIKTIVTLISV